MRDDDGETYVNGELVCGELETGVSDEQVQEELVKRGDFFYDSIDLDAVDKLWQQVASLPVCHLSESSSKELLLDYAGPCNAWINKLREEVKESMNGQ